MPNINPRRLKHWRTKRSLSMEELAATSSVNKSTIYRIESAAPPKRKTRANVLRELAKALNVKEEELAVESDPVPDKPAREPKDRSQVSFNLGNRDRNALSFVSRRYRINPSTIVELAPLLFVMVAEDSLRKRAERLSALHAARLASGTLPSTYSDAAERFEHAEARSIRIRDIFGRQMDDPDIQPPQLPKDVDQVGQWNPLEAHIKEWFARTGEMGGISDWECGPSYSVCREVALAFAGGDEDLATALEEGWMGVHEVPAELRSNDKAEQRLQWMRDRVAAAKSEFEERERASHAEFRAVLAKLGPWTTTKSPSDREENS
ncbi:helix-turn-helix domain-containing protein [Cystobacter fuscus]|uniref:helix-turn-helix domain-containing protein n=1 Tax=Cystobacter fuscus TaxID=43 RepID=UPI002B326274|nr:helix-turn-helix transcriptional regulator [Cystobacter fuscus]